MDDNTNGRRKRVRIGLTLAPDVADVLEKYATEELTRTKIIEQAVREWEEAVLAKKQAQLGPSPVEAILPIQRHGRVIAQAKAANAEIASKSVFEVTTTSAHDYIPMPGPQTYCPHHRPKYCAPDCKYRVAV